MNINFNQQLKIEQTLTPVTTKSQSQEIKKIDAKVQEIKNRCLQIDAEFNQKLSAIRLGNRESVSNGQIKQLEQQLKKEENDLARLGGLKNSAEGVKVSNRIGMLKNTIDILQQKEKLLTLESQKSYGELKTARETINQLLIESKKNKEESPAKIYEAIKTFSQYSKIGEGKGNELIRDELQVLKEKIFIWGQRALSGNENKSIADLINRASQLADKGKLEERTASKFETAIAKKMLQELYFTSKTGFAPSLQLEGVNTKVLERFSGDFKGIKDEFLSAKSESTQIYQEGIKKPTLAARILPAVINPKIQKIQDAVQSIEMIFKKENIQTDKTLSDFVSGKSAKEEVKEEIGRLEGLIEKAQTKLYEQKSQLARLGQNLPELEAAIVRQESQVDSLKQKKMQLELLAGSDFDKGVAFRNEISLQFDRAVRNPDQAGSILFNVSVLLEKFTSTDPKVKEMLQTLEEKRNALVHNQNILKNGNAKLAKELSGVLGDPLKDASHNEVAQFLAKEITQTLFFSNGSDIPSKILELETYLSNLTSEDLEKIEKNIPEIKEMRERYESQFKEEFPPIRNLTLLRKEIAEDSKILEKRADASRLSFIKQLVKKDSESLSTVVQRLTANMKEYQAGLGKLNSVDAKKYFETGLKIPLTLKEEKLLDQYEKNQTFPNNTTAQKILLSGFIKTLNDPNVKDIALKLSENLIGKELKKEVMKSDLFIEFSNVFTTMQAEPINKMLEPLKTAVNGKNLDAVITNIALFKGISPSAKNNPLVQQSIKEIQSFCFQELGNRADLLKTAPNEQQNREIFTSFLKLNALDEFPSAEYTEMKKQIEQKLFFVLYRAYEEYPRSMDNSLKEYEFHIEVLSNESYQNLFEPEDKQTLKDLVENLKAQEQSYKEFRSFFKDGYTKNEILSSIEDAFKSDQLSSFKDKTIEFNSKYLPFILASGNKYRGSISEWWKNQSPESFSRVFDEKYQGILANQKGIESIVAFGNQKLTRLQMPLDPMIKELDKRGDEKSKEIVAKSNEIITGYIKQLNESTAVI